MIPMPDQDSLMSNALRSKMMLRSMEPLMEIGVMQVSGYDIISTDCARGKEVRARNTNTDTSGLRSAFSLDAGRLMSTFWVRIRAGAIRS